MLAACLGAQCTAGTEFPHLEPRRYTLTALLNEEKTMARKPFKLNAMSVAELRQLRDEIQTALAGKIQMERDELQQKLDELAQMESSSNGAAPAKTNRGKRTIRKNGRDGAAVATGRKSSAKRAPVYIRYYDPETGLTYSNRGPMAKWLRAKQEAGENIDKKYAVSASNPLPKKLAHLTPPH
jgi:hypothetical protein